VSCHKKIRPILQRSCQGSHQPAEPNSRLILISYQDFQKRGMSGPGFIAGKPDKSQVIKFISGEKPMMLQEGNPLTNEEVELFRRWIAAGAIDDTPASEGDSIRPNHLFFTRFHPLSLR
jgi:hypothetical protein